MSKICPIMSKNAWIDTSLDEPKIMGVIPCQQNKCQLWIKVYTTELQPVDGCCYELKPQTNSDGLLVV